METIERRIAQHRWDDFTEDQQDEIKAFAQRYASTMGYDHDFAYYWIRFEAEQWLLGNLTDIETARHFT